MPTLADAATRDAIIARIERISPDNARIWGKMSISQMMAHLSDGMRMSYGDLPCAPKGGWLIQTALVKWLVIDKLQWPKGAPTAPELQARTSEPWEAERAQLIALVRRFEHEASRASWPRHPAFGRLTGAQWGRLAWKHVNHHLTQFGA